MPQRRRRVSAALPNADAAARLVRRARPRLRPCRAEHVGRLRDARIQARHWRPDRPDNACPHGRQSVDRARDRDGRPLSRRHPDRDPGDDCGTLAFARRTAWRGRSDVRFRRHRRAAAAAADGARDRTGRSVVDRLVDP